MGTKKIKLPQPETPREQQGRDFFQTPKYAIELLVPFIPSCKEIWEPACGHLKITNVLKKHGYKVLSSDIVYEVDGVVPFNFLTEWRTDVKNDVIITNPPYSLKKKFYERCKEYGLPFALLLPCDYSQWIIDSIRYDGCEKVIPTRRINFITPSGKTEETGGTANFHSMWLTWGFGLGKSETFVELSLEDKKNI